MNVEKSLSSCLAMLGYSASWLDWGLLSETTLREQVARYESDQDKHLEHYRCAAFRKILSSRSALTEEEIKRYIALAREDADSAMAQAALVDLLVWSHLTPEQFYRLTQHPDFALPLFQKRALRRRLLADLNASSPVSAPTFLACLASQDTVVQRTLVAHSKLTSEQLQSLIEQGATRAIRNMAHNRQGVRKKR